ncbi:MAG TPA: DUF819 family protein, partial [Nannocystaceae bacterium]|nr:DUF819 family protein [Nannocystaceae bacterium]
MIDALGTLAVLLGCVAASEWLVRRTALRHVGSAMVVIVLAAVLANVGVIPTAATPVALYDGIFTVVAPVAIVLLLLRVRLVHLSRAGAPLLALFLLGAAATMLGATIGGTLARPLLGEGRLDVLSGMFAATYIGGSVNFNALALHYGVTQDGALYAGATAIDAGLTTVWMAATLGLPRILAGRRAAIRSADGPPEDPELARFEVLPVALLLALALVVLVVSDRISAALADAGLAVPPILVLTTLALVLAQIPAVARLRGTEPLAMLAVYLFLAVIGALCDLDALARLGDIGLAIAVLACTCIAVHGLVVFGVARALRLDPVLAGIASQANIGGSTTAFVVARSLG